MSKVALKKCNSYSDVKSAISESFELLGGIEKFVKKGDKVLLKPNLCDPIVPEKAATTHPKIVKAVAELVKEAGGIVLIGECSAGDSIGRTGESFDVCGINEVAKQTGSRLINFQEEPYVQKNIEDRKMLKKADFAQAIFDADLVINIPKFKTHGITFITGALKNTFGCVHAKNRKLLHKKLLDKSKFADAILDIYYKINPGLTIIDAVIAMEGDEGPSYGPPKKLGYVVISEDGVAADAVLAKMTGHRPLALPIIKNAHSRGMGIGDFDKIEIVGDEFKVVKDFKQSSLFHQELRKHKGFKEEFIFQPLITERCEACGACFDSCPVGAISRKTDGKYTINEKLCIQCLCCQEVCTYGAIDLNKKYLGKFEEENSPKKKQGVANIRLGLDCNQKCLFCTIANDDETMLSTEEVKEKIDMLASEGIATITFTGGEPTIRDDLPELIEYASKKGIITDLQTNAVKMSKEYTSKLKKAGLISILIALHSHKEEISNKITQTKLFSKTIDGIKNALDAGFDVSLSHVINTFNYKFLEEYADFVFGLSDNIHIYFGFLRPNGRTEENKDIVPKLSIIESHVYKALDKCKELGISFEVEGLPLCYMQGFEKHCAESKRLKLDPQRYVASGQSQHKDLHDFIHSTIKEKGDQCNVCSLNKMCVGVWKEYADIYGTDELYPIFKDVKW